MADFQLEIKGLNELRAQLLRFPAAMDQKILNGPLLAGAKPVREAARNLAPIYHGEFNGRVIPGLLSREIRMAAARRPAPGMTATVIIGTRQLSKAIVNKTKKAAWQGSKKKINTQGIIGNPFYWRFMEFGYTDRSGQWHGPHNGKGFLRPAFAQKVNTSIVIITKETAKQIQRVAKKLGLKAT